MKHVSTPTIICLHGLGAAKASFDSLRDTKLSRDHEIVALDFAGFGDRSNESAPRHPLQAAVKEVADYMTRHPKGPFALLGHSMGGAVALLAAEMAPELVAAVVLAEGNLIAEDCGTSRKVANAAGPQAAQAIKDDAVLESSRDPNPGVRAWGRSMSIVSVSNLTAYSEDLVARSDSEDLLKSFIGGAYRKLYLHGDDYVGHKVLGRLRGIPVVYVKNVTHTNLIGDAPTQWAEAIGAFLA